MFSSKARNQEVISIKKLVVLAGAILLSAQAVHAAAIYFENFGNIGTAIPANVGGNTNLEQDGWSGAWGPTAIDSAASSGGVNNFGVSSQVGSPTNLPNIGAAGTSQSISGLVFVSGGAGLPGLTNFIAYTSAFTVDTSLYNVQDISFYAGSTAGTGGVIPGFRIAVQIGGNWYASTQVLANSNSVSAAANFRNPPGGPTGGGQQVTFNWTTTASAWDSLTFISRNSLALGSVLGSDLPGGNITAFGLYSDVNVAGAPTRRFDSYQIDAIAVPEPSSVALVLIGAVTLLGLRRSRKT